MSYDRRRPPDVESLVSVKIDNLSYRTTADQLKRAFDKFGEIGDVYIPRDPYGHEASRGFGFVRFYDSRDADDAVHAMDGVSLNGREIRVQLARHNRSHRSDFVSSRNRRNFSRRSRSTSRSRSRNRKRKSRSSSRDRRRRNRSRSNDRNRRSRSIESRKKDLSRSRSPSSKRSRLNENGSKSPRYNDETLKTDITSKDVDIPSSLEHMDVSLDTVDECVPETQHADEEEQSGKQTSALNDGECSLDQDAHISSEADFKQDEFVESTTVDEQMTHFEDDNLRENFHNGDREEDECDGSIHFEEVVERGDIEDGEGESEITGTEQHDDEGVHNPTLHEEESHNEEHHDSCNEEYIEEFVEESKCVEDENDEYNQVLTGECNEEDTQ